MLPTKYSNHLLREPGSQPAWSPALRLYILEEYKGDILVAWIDPLEFLRDSEATCLIHVLKPGETIWIYMDTPVETQHSEYIRSGGIKCQTWK